MERNKKDIIYCLVFGLVFVAITLACWFKPADAFSEAERRPLNQFPKLSMETLSNGSFMKEFEEYTLDQFPWRDEFRGLKSFMHLYVFGHSDNNDMYLEDGYICKQEYPLSEQALQNMIRKCNSIYDRFISGSDAKTYYAVIPDKNYFLADESGHLKMDYSKIYSEMEKQLKDMTYIEIQDLLGIEDFYYTDTHWKQENIWDVANRLAGEMGVPLKETYSKETIENPFYGVYYGQLGLALKGEDISYMNHPLFEECIVTDFEHQKEIPVYNLEKATGRDPYELFLSGSLSLITIENPNATTDKELVLFRDSFGSSIAPYMIEAYKKITLLDVRYLNENMIGNFVEFTNQDVLFLYSTSVINNETAFK